MNEQQNFFKELNKKQNEQIDQMKKGIAQSIAETFKYWKKEENMTQQKFAKLIGCSQPRVSNIINGNVEKFTIDKLISFCLRLGMSSNIQNKPLKNIKSETRKIIDVIDNENVV